jgi:hypothetical protein
MIVREVDPGVTPSPVPTQSVPSGAALTVPMLCENPSDGMQSVALPGAGQVESFEVPSNTFSLPTTLEPAPTVIRVSRFTFGAAVNC